MGLMRRKPFAILAAIVAFSLLILSCLTVQRACYFQFGLFTYSKIVDEPWCLNECGNNRAIKKLAFMGNGNLQPVQNDLGLVPGTNPGGVPGNSLRVYTRCPWRGTTNRLFLAFASLMSLWVILELLLGAYRKYHFLLNIILLLVIGFGIPTAIYQLSDIHFTSCPNDVFGQSSANGTNYTVCYYSLFNVSFILTILAMLLLLMQLIYNIIFRKKINEKDPQYASIPNQSAPSEPAQQIVNQPVVGGPGSATGAGIGTGDVANQLAPDRISENKI